MPIKLRTVDGIAGWICGQINAHERVVGGGWWCIIVLSWTSIGGPEK